MFMEFTNLGNKEFTDFINENFSHYTQSIEHYNYRTNRHADVHLVGVKDANGKVIAACLLTGARALRFFRYYYTHRGPVMDYTNLDLVQFFYVQLAKYLKKMRGLYVLTDPYLLENIRDCKGNVTQSFDNSEFISTMESLGYKHQGFTVGYSLKSQIRWLSVLDLKGKSEDELMKEMHYQTRRNIKKTYEMDVKVRDLSIAETERFYRLFRMAEEKHGFKFRDIEYFKLMQEMYEHNGFIKLAYIDLEELLDKQQSKLKQLEGMLAATKEQLLKKPDYKRIQNKHEEEEKQVNSLKKKIQNTKDLIEKDGKVLDLAAALYIFNNHEMYYLSSGSNPKYNAYMGAYRLQWEMIKFAKDKGIDRYNFYGITGDFSETAEDYGVQRFKEGFDAHVEEYIGDFIKPIHPFVYKLYKRLG